LNNYLTVNNDKHSITFSKGNVIFFFFYGNFLCKMFGRIGKMVIFAPEVKQITHFMKSKILLLCAMACSMSLQAQVSQKVQVLEYQGDEKKTALQGVEVSVINAGSTMSDAKGQVDLQFRTLHTGDKVNVRRLQKSGYEIFNKAALDQWTISPTKPFRLVMCRTDQFSQLCEEYWKISSESYRKQYEQDQKKLESLYKQQQLKEEEYNTRLEELKTQFDAQLNNLENYVDQFARIDLSELSKQEKKIVALVREGKTDEAIALYEGYGYLDKYNQQTSDILKIDQAKAELSKLEAKKLEERASVQSALRRQITTYQMVGGRENFNKATELFRQAAMADTLNLPLLYDYALFCFDQNGFQTTLDVIDIYLRNLGNDPYRRMLALRLRAREGMEMRKFDVSIANLTEALEIARPMLAEDKAEQVEFLACQIYNNLIDIYSAMGDEAIEPLIKEFEPRLDSLYQLYPDQYLFEMGQFGYCRALYAMLSKGDFETAMQYLVKSAKIVEPVLDKTNSRDQDDVITGVYYYLPVLYKKMNQPEQALSYQKTSLERLERLYAKNPTSYVISLVSAYANMADIYGALKQYDEADRYLARAFESLEVVKGMTDAYYEYIVAFNVVGFRIYTTKGDDVKRKEYAEKVVNNFSTLPEWTKQQYQRQFDLVQQFLDSLKK